MQHAVQYAMKYAVQYVACHAAQIQTLTLNCSCAVQYQVSMYSQLSSDLPARPIQNTEVNSDSLAFPCATRPKNAVGQPLIVGFADRAKPAFAAAVYLRWRVPYKHDLVDETYEASLLWA